MRLILSLLLLGSIGVGGWYAWENFPQFHSLVDRTVGEPAVCTLEIRHTVDEIMQAHKKELLKKNGYHYLEPQLLFYPYLLMEVKYSRGNASTKEGILLWGLSDGEMVLDTETWEKSHGFEDCILSKASKNDFKILRALIEKGGFIDQDNLHHYFKIDREVVENWIDSCREKKLIVSAGNAFRLHFQNGYLPLQPVTQFHESLVTLPSQNAYKTKKHYTPSQIVSLAEVAFGHDFAVRKTQEVFLPVYKISVQNPDGSILTTYWNALNGMPLQEKEVY